MIKKLLSDIITRKETISYYWKIRAKARIPGMRGMFARRRHKKLMQKNCADIALSAKIDGMPVFPHGLNGIFVSKGAKIGKNAVIFHQTTIGSNTVKNSKTYGFPTIGDNVYIGTGAKIIGGITVGNNVRIGANCVVVTDIPDNATVVMDKPRIIIKETPQDNRFFPYE